jgi:3-oxoacyl-[acyl-carrier-protein] synthase-3
MNPKEVYISGISYVLGELESITEIEELQSNAMSMDNFLALGLESYAVSVSSPSEMAIEAGRKCLEETGVLPERIDMVIYATETFGSPSFSREDIRKFCAALNLRRAYPQGLFLSECANIQTGLRMASDSIISGRSRNVLLVTTDKCMDGDTRILPPNLSILSDGASACLITSEKPSSGFQVIDTFCWTDPELYFVDPSKNFKEYFQRTLAGVKSVGTTLLENNKLHPTDITGVIVNNYNTSIMYTLVTQIGFTLEQTCLNNLAAFGHAFASDNLINLKTHCANINSQKDDLFLLSASGPTTWGAALVKQI